MPLEAWNYDSVFGKPIPFVDSSMDVFSCFDKLFNVRVCEVCSVTYMQAPVIQSIRCPVEPAVNSSQAPNRGSSDDRDTFASPCFAYFSGDETP